MATRSFELRELFHLTLLRHLSARLSGRSYAVKGGICLRFFHGSPRLSEDMDLDVAPQIRVETLRRAVDGVLSGAGLRASLLPAGVEGLSSTAPKQTETTQRWKVALVLAGGGTLPTTLEFSRRREALVFATGIPDAELLRRCRQPAFAAQYYDAASMAAQKTRALASPTRSALRDLFDLHHLLFVAGVPPAALSRLASAEDIAAAADKAGAFTFSDFKEQVAPYLSGELMDLYRGPEAFLRQKDEVERTLLGLLP